MCASNAIGKVDSQKADFAYSPIILGYSLISKQVSVSQSVSNEFITRERPGKGIRSADGGPATNVLRTYVLS